MAYLLFTINIVVVILDKHLENYWRTALNNRRCYYIVMVKTLKEVRIQPGPSVRFERLCVKKKKRVKSFNRSKIRPVTSEGSLKIRPFLKLLCKI